MYVLLIVTYLQKQFQDRTLLWKDYLLLMSLRRRRTPLLTCSATSRPPSDRSDRTVCSKCQTWEAQVKEIQDNPAQLYHRINKKICNGCTLYIGKNICRREDQINRGVNRYLCHCSEKALSLKGSLF